MARQVLAELEAEERLQEFIRKENGSTNSHPVLPADDAVTFDWFVAERYLPMRQGQWRFATAQKTTFEINRYTRAVNRPTMTSGQIIQLISAIKDPHDLCLMSIGLLCATRTSETLGLQWKSYAGDRLIVCGTAYEGRLYKGKVKTDDSRDSIPVPEAIRPVIEAWRKVCKDASPEALMFSTTGRKGGRVPRQAKNFLKWRIHPDRRQAWNSQRARNIPSDATHVGNGSATARYDERRPTNTAACEPKNSKVQHTMIL